MLKFVCSDFEITSPYITMCVCVCICSDCNVMTCDLEITTDKFVYSRYTNLGICALCIVSNYLLQILQRGW
jgi:hypothetical protein